MSLLLVIDFELSDLLPTTNITIADLKALLLKASGDNAKAVALMSELYSDFLTDHFQIIDLTKPYNLKEYCDLKISMKKTFTIGFCKEMNVCTELFKYKIRVNFNAHLNMSPLGSELGLLLSDSEKLSITSSPLKQRGLEFIIRRLKAISKIQNRTISYADVEREMAKLNYGKPKSTKLMNAPLVGGYADAKIILDQTVTWFFQKQDEIKKFGITPSKGALLYGPPGCGKTLIAKSVASKSNANFIAIQIPEVIKGFVGDSEKAIHNIFLNAKKNAPSILFLDEIDSLFNSDEHSLKISAQLSFELDDLQDEQVVVLAATNYIGKVNKTIIRSGRIDTLIEIGLPTDEDRRDILSLLFKKLQIEAKVNLDQIVFETDGMTGSVLQEIVRKASIIAVSRDQIMTQEDVDTALKEIKGDSKLR